jgi:hypothetical protein
VNDALAVYFVDVTLATAFVARWCVAKRVEDTDGVYRVHDDESTMEGRILRPLMWFGLLEYRSEGSSASERPPEADDPTSDPDQLVKGDQ